MIIEYKFLQILMGSFNTKTFRGVCFLMFGVFLFFGAGLNGDKAEALSDEIASSVVQIQIYDSQGDWYVGSGIVLNSGQDLMFLTAAHVVLDPSTGNPAKYIFICPVESESSMPDCVISARVIDYQSDLDLALLQPAFRIDDNLKEYGEFLWNITGPELGVNHFELSKLDASVGEQVTFRGFPAASLSPSIVLTRGTISSLATIFVDEINSNLNIGFSTDATINPGNSGGPALDSDNQVLGIVSAVSTQGVGGNYGLIVSNKLISFWLGSLFMDWGLEQDISQAMNRDLSIFETIDRERLLKQEYPYMGYSAQTFVEQPPFPDVQVGHKNFDAIKTLKNWGVLGGYPDGTFKPYNSINRAELLKVLMEGLGYSPSVGQYSNCFPDVGTDWFAPYVCFAKDQNWISGYQDGTFRPGASVNKAEAIKMLIEVFEVTAVNPQIGNTPYTDVPFEAWFAGYVQTAISVSILEESLGGPFSPGADMTRGGFSENLYRLWNYIETDGSLTPSF